MVQVVINLQSYLSVPGMYVSSKGCVADSALVCPLLCDIGRVLLNSSGQNCLLLKEFSVIYGL
jgi:hypothetical protein